MTFVLRQSLSRTRELGANVRRRHVGELDTRARPQRISQNRCRIPVIGMGECVYPLGGNKGFHLSVANVQYTYHFLKGSFRIVYDGWLYLRPSLTVISSTVFAPRPQASWIAA